MYFIILTTDRPDSTHIRQETRPAHLDYIQGFGKQIVAGGATLADDGEVMTGSFILVEMPDRGAVQAFLRNDPYVQAGLFDTVEVRRWRKVIFNAPES
jgi:uncharacterized protein